MDHPSNLKNKEVVEKPWGRFTRFTLNEPSTVKVIEVKKGESISMQSHKSRSEFWKVLSGNPYLTIGDREIKAKAGDEFFITPNTRHRQRADTEDVEILEISFGNFDEEDITRLEDKYGRV